MVLNFISAELNSYSVIFNHPLPPPGPSSSTSLTPCPLQSWFSWVFLFLKCQNVDVYQLCIVSENTAPLIMSSCGTCQSSVTAWKQFDSLAHRSSSKWPIPLCSVHITQNAFSDANWKTSHVLNTSSTLLDLLTVMLVETHLKAVSHFNNASLESALWPLTCLGSYFLGWNHHIALYVTVPFWREVRRSSMALAISRWSPSIRKLSVLYAFKVKLAKNYWPYYAVKGLDGLRETALKQIS